MPLSDLLRQASIAQPAALLATMPLQMTAAMGRLKNVVSFGQLLVNSYARPLSRYSLVLPG